MDRTTGLLGVALPIALCAHAGAQSAHSSTAVTTDVQGGGSTRTFIYPKNGQTEAQQSQDRYECHTWANTQSGFDPSVPGGGVPPSENASRRDSYQRAMAACLEARGYNVSFPAAAPPTPVPAPPVNHAMPVLVEHSSPPTPLALNYHPFAVHIDGGYDITSGATRQNLDNGANVGLGITWFPTSSLPLGVRLDGSYNTFRARDGLLNMNGAGYTSGRENIYGGDADLQLDLAHRSSRSKFYLFGGVGRYREQTSLRQVSQVNDSFCDPYFGCGPGRFSTTATTVDRATSAWHNSWNAGLGWETAIAAHSSFFIEARFLRILPNGNKTQFVPIRLGFRF